MNPRPATILVVDDDLSSREVLALLLREEGYRVLEAADAAEALALLDREIALDVLLTDLQLPGASGRELAVETKARFRRAQVIFLSGMLTAPAPEEGVFLRKPAALDDILAAVRRATGEDGADDAADAPGPFRS
jgi:CheY-like chemotaxis protein